MQNKYAEYCVFGMTNTAFVTERIKKYRIAFHILFVQSCHFLKFCVFLLGVFTVIGNIQNEFVIKDDVL